MVKNYSIVIAIILSSVIFMTGKAFSETSFYRLSIISESEAGMALYLRLDQDISLDELISSAGYDIDSEDMPSFLMDFVRLNETVNSIAVLEEGTVIKLPLKYLKKIADTRMQAEPAEHQIALQEDEQQPEQQPSEQQPPEQQPSEQQPFVLPGTVEISVQEHTAPTIELSDVMCDEQDLIELSLFSDREKAVNLLHDLKKSGYDAYFCKDIGMKTGPVYKVFFKKETEPSGPSAGSVTGAGKEAAFQTNLHETVSDTKGDQLNIFDRKKRYLHPFISITGLFTDNVLNTGTTRKSDFVTVISPGIWLAVPDTGNRLPFIDSSSMAPGGFVVENLMHESFRRFQTYFLYQADLQRFNRNSSENNVKHRLEGNLEFKLRGGLSMALQDQCLISHDERGTEIANELSRFQSNLFNLFIVYDTRHKTLFRAGYTNFIVDYDQPGNSFRRRMDNAFSASAFYAIRPKIFLFGEYRLVDINYDEESLLDGREQHLFGGVRWNVSSKTEGFLKVGYGSKSFNSNSEKSKDFILESNINYSISAKSSLHLTAWRKTNETNIENTLFVLTNGIRAAFTHKIFGKLSAFANLSYVNYRYRGDFTFNGKTGRREDRYVTAGLGIQHQFRRWLTNEIGYTYSRRDSNFPAFDYSGNTLYFRVSGAM